ncbi:SHD1 domain-containing protein [Mariniblastus sp.]|nr:SHD1 domain-containing protein [Mariniblastus sp.]
MAQQKVEVDEDVRIYFHGWKDGVVTEVDKKQAMVEFSYANSTRQQVFDRHDIRRMHEVDAMDFDRKWSSSDGNFKVTAALKKILDDKVLLIKTDLEEIEVPVARLSKSDASYVKKIKKNRERAIKRGDFPAPTPELPELETFDQVGQAIASFSTMDETTLQPLGATPSYLTTFEQQGVGFGLLRNKQELIAVIPVGGPEQLVLMSFREKGGEARDDRFQSMLYWVSLKDTKVVATVPLTHEDFALDYDPKTKRLITFNRKRTHGSDSEPDHYTVWELQAGANEAKPIIRWEGAGPNWAGKLFAKVINDRVVLTKTEKKHYQAYDIVDKKVLYSYETESFFSAPPVLTKDRQHFIVPEDGQIRVMDAATGKLKFSVTSGGQSFSGANVNDDGTKLAGLTSSNLYVWDLTSGDTTPNSYLAPLIGTPFGARMEWLDDDSILVEGSWRRTLYRLSLELPIWSYEMDVWQRSINRDPLKSMMVAGKYFYVAKPDHWGSTIAVGAVDLPGPQVDEITNEIDKPSLMIMKPGKQVRIDVSKVSDSRIKDWLSEKVKKAQWVEDPNASKVLIAEMGIGESRTVTYQNFRTRKTTKVSYRPHYARLLLKEGKRVLWRSGSSSGHPMTIRDGDNISKEVNKSQSTQVGFFEGVNIDPEILDPTYSRGFGVSTLGLNGIRVTSTTPPGREDDPWNVTEKESEGESSEKNGEASENNASSATR